MQATLHEDGWEGGSSVIIIYSHAAFSVLSPERALSGRSTAFNPDSATLQPDPPGLLVFISEHQFLVMGTILGNSVTHYLGSSWGVPDSW